MSNRNQTVLQMNRTVLQICYSSYTLLNFRSRTNSIPTSPMLRRFAIAVYQPWGAVLGFAPAFKQIWQSRGGSRGSCGGWQPSAMETGAPAPLAQGSQFSYPFYGCLSPRSIFAPSALYGRLPASQGVLLIGIGTLFAHDGAF